MRDENGHLVVVNRVIEGKHDGENLAHITFGILKDARYTSCKDGILTLMCIITVLPSAHRPTYYIYIDIIYLTFVTTCKTPDFHLVFPPLLVAWFVSPLGIYRGPVNVCVSLWFAC